MFGAGDEFADDWCAGNLAGDQQTARGLGVGQQQRLVLVDGREVDVRADPVEVAPGAAADVAAPSAPPAHPSRYGTAAGVDHRRDAAGPGQLVQVAEQTEAGDVRGTFDARLQRRRRGLAR